jgi:hypothetical protein
VPSSGYIAAVLHDSDEQTSSSTSSTDEDSSNDYSWSHRSREYGTSDEVQESVRDMQERNRKMQEKRLVDDVDYFD